jgi:hypothetical protein
MQHKTLEYHCAHYFSHPECSENYEEPSVAVVNGVNLERGSMSLHSDSIMVRAHKTAYAS